MLTLAGFLTWLIGAIFEYPEIAFIGGTIVVAVGGMIVQTGLEYQTGETVIENTTYEGNVQENGTIYNTSETSKDVQFQYRSVPFPQQFPGGVLLMIIGGLLATRQMGEDGGFM